MECPRCKKALTLEEVDGERLNVCRSCGGLWVRRHQLNRLLPESGGDVESCSIDGNPHGDYHRYIRCAECADSRMKKISFLEYSDIILDYCASCGSFWLDRDELSKMHGYLKKIDEGSHEVTNLSAHSLLTRLSEIAYSIFR
jgi:Zn-finger nucleic acid-binding protein